MNPKYEIKTKHFTNSINKQYSTIKSVESDQEQRTKNKPENYSRNNYSNI